MDKSEILYSYKSAKHKVQQIKVLSELNACSVDDIILAIADGLRSESKEDDPESEKTDINIMQKLENELDRLDEEIREREKQYQEVVVAMKIVSIVSDSKT